MVPNRSIYVSPHNCPALQPLLCCTICQRQSWPLAFCRPSGGFPIPPSAGLWARSKAAEKPAPCRLQQEPLDGSKAFRKGRWGKRLCRELVARRASYKRDPGRKSGVQQGVHRVSCRVRVVPLPKPAVICDRDDPFFSFFFSSLLLSPRLVLSA